MSEPNRACTIRKCRISDLRGVLDVEKASFPDPYDRPTFVQLLLSEPSGFLVAEGSGMIQGYVIASSRYGTGLIVSIAVSPDRKRKGIGSALMQAALLYLAGRVRRVELQVSVRNTEAIAFYREFSFHELGTIRGYYPNGDDGLVMAKQF